MKKIDISEVPSFFNVLHIDKGVHFVMYFILGAVLCYEVGLSTFFKKMFVLLFPIFYGGIIELIQKYAVHRTGDLIDFVADIAGGFLGVISCFLFLRKQK